MDKYRAILKEYWGYDSFRGVQEEIIRSIGAGKDTLGLMPTGGGKSITFQVPALTQEGLCLVITPLIALMKDQVRNLRERGIKALAIYSGMNREEIMTVYDNCIFGDYKFLYISPERIATELFLQKVQKMHISMITVDESHCISQWGYDFRPAYLNIADIRRILPSVPILALTATATPKVVKDIQHQLSFAQENVFSMSFERENVAYVVRKTEDKYGQLLHILSKVQGSAIVYARNRRHVKEWAERLESEGFTATYYHAGLSNHTKDERQHAWVTDKKRIMVATNAFGMGIDKPDVRLVIHMDFPDSIEAYFQEAGRAGRDGKQSYAVLLHSRGDKTALKKRLTDTFPTREEITKIYDSVNYYYQMAAGDGAGRSMAFDVDLFCVRFKFFPTKVVSALHILGKAGYMEYEPEPDNKARVMILLKKEELYRLESLEGETERIFQYLLRSYTGLFADDTYISEEFIAMRADVTRQKVYETLIRLSKAGIIRYIPANNTPRLYYLCDRVEGERLFIPREVYEERRDAMKEQQQALLDYADMETACRSRILLRYFGEKNEHECGKCDYCLRKKTNYKATFEEVQNILISRLAQQPLLPQQLTASIDADNELIGDVLRYLEQEEVIELRDFIYHLL